MKYLRPNRYVSLFIFIILSAFMISIAFLGGSVRAADLVAQEIVQEKVEPLVLKEITSSGTTDFFVWMKEKANLRPAHSLRTKKAKGQFVYRTLRDTANRTQNGVKAQLNRLGVDYRSFYIANKILVRDGDMTLVNLLAARPDVSRITANHIFQLQEPFVDSNPPAQVADIESNISFINAPDVWALGYKGAGIVLAGNDTGLDWDHPAIKNQYRGWNGSTVDHNYNWWDATGTYPSVPDDGHGHGTHTTGTMVGDDGNGNQIGVAPEAKTIHCKNMTDSGSGSDATFTECFQFVLAPWDLTGNNPDSQKAPDAVNNSWGYWGGNEPQFEDEISALQEAGILVEVSAGNEGPSCGTLRSPGDYGQVLTTGSVNHAGGSLPGTISGFSSRGPSDLYPNDFLPDIMAPGESIRSSLPGGNNYASWSGTSMAGPHVTALVGLMWNASPALRGDVSTTVQAILGTAVPLDGQVLSCGGDYTDGPNNDWGYGTIDALAAVQEAIQLGAPFRVEATPVDQTVCALDPSVSARYDVDVTKNDPNFTGTVELTVSDEPAGTVITFNPLSVVLNETDTGSSSEMTILITKEAKIGRYELDVIGTWKENPEETSTSKVWLEIFSSAPETVTLSQPANGAEGVDLKPFFAWEPASQASSYFLEVAKDYEFSNIVYSTTVESASHTAESMLDSSTTYYWRTRATNVCGEGSLSDPFSFTTLDYFTELFSSDNDLDNLSLTFKSDGSFVFYSACAQSIVDLPVDPVGGTTLSLSDDYYATVTLSIGNWVSLYGTPYNTFYVGSNGYITFTTGDSDYSESLADHFDLPRISPLFDDLDPSSGGTVRWQELNDRVVVTWQGVPQFNGSGSNTFQVQLFFDSNEPPFDGAIVISYLSIDAPDGLAGLSEGNGTPSDFSESDLSAMGACTCGYDSDCDDGLFCNGLEECDLGRDCQTGSDPCPGQGCDETNDQCIPLVCNNGTCDPGEDCNNCPNDCISGGEGEICGNGICEPAAGEDCLFCPEDCAGKQRGKLSKQFCCGNGDGVNPVGCNDARCTSEGFACDSDTGSYCCGDGNCDGAEDSYNCEVDCGPPPVCGDGTCDPGEDPCSCPGDCGTETETDCDDGIDNDCNGLTDGADPNCPCLPRSETCADDGECCSNWCHRGKCK